jgi:hypothetical protein
MPTIKKRISITADTDVEEALIRSAKRDNLTVTTKATELLRLALELEEDLVLSAIATERESKRVRYISHAKLWA